MGKVIGCFIRRKIEMRTLDIVTRDLDTKLPTDLRIVICMNKDGEVELWDSGMIRIGRAGPDLRI